MVETPDHWPMGVSCYTGTQLVLRWSGRVPLADMFSKIRIAGALWLTLLLVGCGMAPVHEQPSAPAGRIDLANKMQVKRALYDQFEQWRAVKYKSGGLSRDGVDCSGFVYLTFNSRLGIDLPRSTDQQVLVGKSITQNDLTPGDLVFFRTGKSTRHVGIYLEDGKFVHASTDKGVMISRLSDNYWARAYWKSIRIGY